MAELKNEGLPYRLYTDHAEIVPPTWDGRPDIRVFKAGESTEV